jgi:hypothetical protein
MEITIHPLFLAIIITTIALRTYFYLKSSYLMLKSDKTHFLTFPGILHWNSPLLESIIYSIEAKEKNKSFIFFSNPLSNYYQEIYYVFIAIILMIFQLLHLTIVFLLILTENAQDLQKILRKILLHYLIYFTSIIACSIFITF